MDYSLPGSSIHGISQARQLRRVAIPFSRGPSSPRDQTRVSYISGGFFTVWAAREAPIYEEFKVNLGALKTPGVQIHRAKNWGDKTCSLLCINVLPTKYTCRGELFRRSLWKEKKNLYRNSENTGDIKGIWNHCSWEEENIDFLVKLSLTNYYLFTHNSLRKFEHTWNSELNIFYSLENSV